VQYLRMSRLPRFPGGPVAQLSVLVEADGDLWIAQCVERDLATQAGSLAELHDEIDRMIVGHVVASEEAGVEPFAIPAAPAEVGDRFSAATLSIRPVASRVSRSGDLARAVEALRCSIPTLDVRIVA